MRVACARGVRVRVGVAWAWRVRGVWAWRGGGVGVARAWFLWERRVPQTTFL